MIRPFMIPAAQLRATRLLVGFLVGTLIVATAFGITSAPRFGQPNADGTTVTKQHPGYGAGYPLHGGLAGPSRVQRALHPGYGAGYPLHGGLAGPSSVEVQD